MREKFLKHPIYHDLAYSIRSSRYESASVSPPKRVRLSAHAPGGKPKHQRVKSGWQDPNLPPKTPTKDSDLLRLPNRSTFYIEESPKTKPRTPEKARVSVRPMSLLSRTSSTNKETLTKAPSVSVAVKTDACESPLDSPPPLNDDFERWSWTNSQAPSTPRVNPTSRRASLASTRYSVPRFRSVRSWALGQGERLRIDEEAPPLLDSPPPPPLQPVPANKRAFKDATKPDLSKKTAGAKKWKGLGEHKRAGSSLGNLGSLFKSTPNLGAAAGRDLERGVGGEIEMKERQRSR